MDILLNLLVVLEMLLVNLFVLHSCCHKKYTTARTLAVLLGFSLVIVSLAYLFLQRSPHFGNGNGLFALIGFIYLIPFSYLYQEGIREQLSIICSSWIYTMFAFSLSVHIVKIFEDGTRFAPYVLMVQTLLYLLSALPFFRWIKSRFIFVLRHITVSTQRFLLYTSLSWFASILILNLAFVYPQTSIIKLLSLLLFFINALFTYSLIYRLVRSSQSIEHLEQIAYIDLLTGLRNRIRLFTDAENLIKSATPFTLLFMDLDYFKHINDRYGHLMGDRYLRFFADSVLALLDKQGRLYRMSGDEFICLHTGEQADLFIRQLKTLDTDIPGTKIHFEGCSTGMARYPADSADLDTLIRLADERMYQRKRAR